MDFFGKKEHPHGDTIVNIDQIIINFGEEKEHHHREHKMRHKLVFNILINNKNYNSMAIITSLNLTSTTPVQLFMTVVDQNNSPIAGVLTLQSVTPSDASQDIAVLDPTTPDDVDIHAVALQGGTGVVAVGSFVSTAVNPDGTPVLTGTFTSDALAVTNNIVVTTPPTGKLVFNQ